MDRARGKTKAIEEEQEGPKVGRVKGAKGIERLKRPSSSIRHELLPLSMMWRNVGIMLLVVFCGPMDGGGV